MAILAGLPILAFAVILQSSIFARVPLLNGIVDLVLVVVVCWGMNERVRDEWVWAIMAGVMLGFTSAAPFWLPVLSLLAVTALSIYLKRRIWQIPVLGLFLMIVAGTLITQTLSVAVLSVLRTPIPLVEALNLVVLPSLLLNLIAVLPVNGLIGEIAAWLYPEEIE